MRFSFARYRLGALAALLLALRGVAGAADLPEALRVQLDASGNDLRSSFRAHDFGKTIEAAETRNRLIEDARAELHDFDQQQRLDQALLETKTYGTAAIGYRCAQLSESVPATTAALLQSRSYDAFARDALQSGRWIASCERDVRTLPVRAEITARAMAADERAGRGFQASSDPSGLRDALNACLDLGVRLQAELGTALPAPIAQVKDRCRDRLAGRLRFDDPEALSPLAAAADALPAASPCSEPNVAAHALTVVQAQTPPEAVQLHISGEVTVIVTLDETSRIVWRPVVVSAPSDVLIRSAIAAAVAATYQTEIRRCRPVPGSYRFIVDFLPR